MNSTLQNILIILGIVAIGALGYYLFIQNNDISLQNSEIDNQAAVETSVFLQRLNELKLVRFDGAIFADARFMSLVDSTEIVVPVPVGRSNPFIESN
jgi:hypothetical protein